MTLKTPHLEQSGVPRKPPFREAHPPSHRDWADDAGRSNKKFLLYPAGRHCKIPVDPIGGQLASVVLL